jgi:hypothetical protein
MSGTAGRAIGAALVLAAAGCVGDRDRLDAPNVVLELGDQAAPPGGTITGTVTATDRSGGIILVSVTAQAGDSTFRQRADFIGSDSVSLLFALHVASNVPAEAPIIVRATVLDQQSFVVTEEDTAVVSDPGVP